MTDSAPTYIVDGMLGKLARWLRLLGLDTRYIRRRQPAELRTAGDGRILVTRDHRLAAAGAYPGAVILIETDDWRQQVPEFLAKSGARCHVRPFTRCPECNGRLAETPAAHVAGKVPRYVFLRHDRFCRCTDCGRIYWPGSHQRRLRQMFHQWGLADSLPDHDT